MNDKYRVADLANANGQDLVKFITDNSQVIGEVEQHLENLEKLGGTSKAHALGYQEYLPEDVNIEDFSNHLSKKGYQMSMESLSQVLLVAASVAVVAGVGYLAYKMIKASMSKKPKSAELASKVKEVERLAGIMANVDLTTVTKEFQDLFLAKIKDDCIPAAIAGANDADILKTGFSIYMRDELSRSGATNYSLALVGKDGGDCLFYAASDFIAGLKPVLEAFRVEFLDVALNKPELFEGADVASLAPLVGTNGWTRHETDLIPAIQRFRQWADKFGIVSTDTLSIMTTLEAARDLLFVKIDDDRLREFAKEERQYADVPTPAEYTKFYAGMGEFKKIGEHIKSTGEKFRRAGKMSRAAADIFETNIRHATELFDMGVALENTVRRECDSIARYVSAVSKGAIKYHAALVESAKKMQAGKDRDTMLFEIEDTARSVKGSLAQMAKEDLSDRPRLSTQEVMVLEGHSNVLAVLKMVALIVLLGAALRLLGAAVMAMFGASSLAAGWQGGISYMTKEGKRVTKREAGQLLFDKLKSNRVGQYGCETVTSGGKPPFTVTKAFVNNNFTMVSGAIKSALTSFGNAVSFRGNMQDISESVLDAARRGRHSLHSQGQMVITRMEAMGFNVKHLDPTSPTSLIELREQYDAYHDKWFNAEKASFSSLEQKGLSLTLFTSLDERAPSEIEDVGKAVADDLKTFGRRVAAADKETLEAISPEARAEHDKFMAEIGFLGACAGMMTKAATAAMRDTLNATAAYKATFKMVGESAEGEEPVGEETPEEPVEVEDEVLETMDVAAGLSEAELDYATNIEMVQEKWSTAAKTGILIFGALVLVGVGAFILKSMSKRKQAPQASSEQFKKINAGIGVGAAFDKMSADIGRAAQELSDRANSVRGERLFDLKVPATTNGGSNNAASVMPEASQAAKKEEQARAFEHAAKAFSDLAKDVDKYSYLNRLQKVLEERQAGNGLWRMAMEGPSVCYMSMGEFIQQPDISKVTDLLEYAVLEILHPVNRVVRAGDPVAEAERVYDSVVAAIEKVGSSEYASETYRWADSNDIIAELTATPNKDEIDRYSMRFNERSMSNADGDYQGHYKNSHGNLQKIEDILNLAEQRELIKVNKEAFDSLRGNRDKASSLLRRVDEFKPVFTVLARRCRESHAVADHMLRTTLDCLRVHRVVQQQYVEMYQRYGKVMSDLSLSAQQTIDRIRGDHDANMAAVKKVTSGMDDLSRKLGEAGF